MDKVRLVNTFLQLARLESPSGREELVKDYICQELEKLGIGYEIDKTGNILAFSKAKGNPVILSAHLDTVSPCDSVEPRVAGKWIVSDSESVLGADNKAAVAAILEALYSVPVNERKSLEIVFTVREETDGGINYLNFRKLKSKEGLVADSGAKIGTIILAAPWISDFEIEVSGKSAHTSSPSEGINALTIASEAISKFKWGSLDKNSITNIGIVAGGEASNTVPEKVTLRGEVRSSDGKSLSKILKNIEKIFSLVARKYGGKSKLKDFFYCRGYSFPKNGGYTRNLLTIYKKLGIKPIYTNSFGGSDANLFNAQGIKVVNIGDGAEFIHTTREKISINNLTKLAEVFTEYIKA